MASGVLLRLIICSIVLSLFHAAGAAAAAASGFAVNYGRVADNLPPPPQVAAMAKSEGITKVKIFDADPSILQAFMNTGITMVITVPNDQIPGIAASSAGAKSWFDANAMPFVALIDTILVGNEVLKFSPEMSPILVPAMQNLYTVLKSINLDANIKVSTPHAMDVLEKNSSSPPSNGIFKQEHVATMSNLLGFLRDSNSSLMLNVYPYFALREDKGATLSLDYAVSGGGSSTTTPSTTDPNTHLPYTSLLDAQIDAIYSAMQKLNTTDLAIVVGETGWPTAGGFAATPQNAAIFTRNLVQRTVYERRGTPLKPEFPLQAYAFALFNEDLKHNLMEQNFGLFYPNMTKVYPIDFSAHQ